MPAPKPLIGITLDFEEAGGYSKYPWYALRDNYCASVAAYGGIPIPLPHEVELADHYAELLDGLIITGGNFDVPPEMYGDTSMHAATTVKRRRTQFEWAITEKAIARDMPVFGICGGEQLLNVILGGTLIQHIPDEIPNALEHEQPNPRHEVGHSVKLAEGSELHRIVGTTDIMVNSAHHQAVRAPAKGSIVNAVAPDGVIEGIEMQDKRFLIGVQWHPEFLITDADKALYQAFIDASRDYAKGNVKVSKVS